MITLFEVIIFLQRLTLKKDRGQVIRVCMMAPGYRTTSRYSW